MKEEALYKQLVDRYLDGTASLEEVEVFFQLLNEGKLDRYLEPETPVRKLTPWKRYGIAAAAALLLAVAGLVLLRRPAPEKPVVANVFKNDVSPGGNKAILTLGDGSTIVLDSAANGALTGQIVKTDGALVYKKGAEDLYNSLSTPAGGQYQVTLADGTKVWLNALSKLQYPGAFKGRERIVELTGEAYFEVAKDATKPFTVKVNGVAVGVLGTSFNVNAYNDEPEIRTTLLEGAVRVKKGASELTLKPGQQGIAGDVLTQRAADVDRVMAWKKGFFSWDAADIHTVMRQLSRWYGVEIKYEGAPTKALFGGEIGRDLTLTQVLTGLSESKVHFQLDGKVLTVLP
ncbi:MAG: FecR domain-containing protein [Bacteroidetes bacterium]|nr:FecR domain-containing protein [Bacteroidota bacterium]